jgi:hypothetical protein
MTTAQLEHLRKIDAHLEKLLSQADKRTPGRWVAGATIVGDGIRTTICSTETMGHPWNENRNFIASCAGNTEAGWKATRAAIKDWLSLYNATEGYADGAPDASAHDKLCNEVASLCRINLRHILAAFPLELIGE